MSHQDQVEELLRDAIKPIKEAIEKRDQERNKLVFELERLKRDAARYEVVRKMNSDDFRKLYLRCVFENLRFDDEVDKIGGLKP